MLNILVESTFHWLSKGVLKFEVDVGVYELYATTEHSLQPEIISNSNVSDKVLRHVNIITMTMIEVLPAARLFRTV